MNLPYKAFEIKNGEGCVIGLEIAEIYGFPSSTSFRGGYDIRCNLLIYIGAYKIETNNYYSSTGALFNFYNSLAACHNALDGRAEYRVYMPENDLNINVCYNGGFVEVSGSYRDNPTENNVFNFEFTTDQSYFTSVLQSLKSVINAFGGNKGNCP